jgi:ParB-like nuclease domain
VTAAPPIQIQIWPINRFVLYARNPRKNDAVVDRMCSSIREFGFNIPVLARSDGEVGDGRLRIKAARKLRVEEIPVILCYEWSAAQVKAFRLMVNRSVSWASWDDELLALELQELSESDFDRSLTGFDPGKIDALLVDPEDDEKATLRKRCRRTRYRARAISGSAGTPRPVWRRYEARACGPATDRPRAAANDYRSAGRYRLGFRVARPRRIEYRPWREAHVIEQDAGESQSAISGRTQLPQAPDGMATPRPLSPATRAPIGPKPLSWC